MLTEQVNPTDRIEILSDGSLQIRETTIILRDGVPVSSPIYRRYVLAPGSDLSSKDGRIAAVAGLVWTDDVVKAYIAAQAVEVV
jgi:hypothetical protein